MSLSEADLCLLWNEFEASMESLCSLHQGKFSVVDVVRERNGSGYHHHHFKVLVRKQGPHEQLQREWNLLQQLNQTSKDVSDFLHLMRAVSFERSGGAEEALNSSLCLEAVLGGPLHRHIRLHGVLPMHIARVYSYELVDALITLQDRFHCIHRDLKASNVLVDGRGHIKVCDFGSATILPNDITARRYSVLGTLQSMAPEMVHRTCGYRYSVDWWALGVLVYEMLTGSPPPFTWHASSSGNNNNSPKCTRQQPDTKVVANGGLVSEAESNVAQRAMRDVEYMSSDWHFASVNTLLSMYPNPPLPRGDVLNNIHVIEQRLAYEEIQHANDFITLLLQVQVEQRLAPTRAQLDNRVYVWLKQPKFAEASSSHKYAFLEFDDRAGCLELLRNRKMTEGSDVDDDNSARSSDQGCDEVAVDDQDLFREF
jgi:serine/threonine protein kinase